MKQGNTKKRLPDTIIKISKQNLSKNPAIVGFLLPPPWEKSELKLKGFIPLKLLSFYMLDYGELLGLV
jgi:hypothetical protein